MFEELKKNPLLQKALAAGEERVGKTVTALLSNERVMAGVQKAFTSALDARAAVERGVKTAMQAVNLPTTDDVAELKKRLAELESIIDGLAARMDREGAPPEAADRPGTAGAAPAQPDEEKGAPE